jgi:hypothetical protein
LGAIKPKWRKHNSQNLVCLPLPKGDLPFHDYLWVDPNYTEIRRIMMNNLNWV